ncbi:hypothetical protein ACF05T_20900 [Streptomyces lateritius]|uniref:Uncharacterized protein n=1 Tax=Streptomyces lateritius TaxID=67313 RepID=A0ABW6YFB1_9ACTN
MSEDDWAASNSTGTVLLLAALAVHPRGVIGFARDLSRIMMRSPALRAAGTARRPISSGDHADPVARPVAGDIVYPARRIAARRRRH